MGKEKITIETIDKLLSLSCLELTKSEKESFVDEITSIIEMLDKCGDINTSGENQGRIIGLESLREDVVGESLPVSDVLKNAPESNRGYLVTPKVVE